MSIKHFQVAATQNVPWFYMQKAKEAGSNQAGHCHSLLISEKCLSWEQEQKHFRLCNVPQEGAIGFVMNLSNHWMALLYTNVPVSTSSWARAGCCAKEINSDPRGSGHRDLTNPLNNIQTSLSCLAVRSRQRVWSEWTKPTSQSKLTTRLSAFFFPFTLDQIFSQFLMVFLHMRWEKESFVIYDHIKLLQGKRTQTASDDLTEALILQTCWPTAQLPGAHGSRGGSQLRLFSWAGYSCAVWKAKLKKKEKKIGCLACSAFMWAPDYGDQVIIPSAVPLRVTAATQHVLIQLCPLLHHLLIRNQLVAK